LLLIFALLSGAGALADARPTTIVERGFADEVIGAAAAPAAVAPASTPSRPALPRLQRRQQARTGGAVTLARRRLYLVHRALLL
jgi:hypothetical protein